MATPPAPTATTGRTQLRGSRSARSSLSESSSAQIGELLGRGLGDRAEGVLEPAREPLRRLDRPQRVGEQVLDVPGAAVSARSGHSSLISS